MRRLKIRVLLSIWMSVLAISLIMTWYTTECKDIAAKETFETVHRNVDGLDD